MALTEVLTQHYRGNAHIQTNPTDLWNKTKSHFLAAVMLEEAESLLMSRWEQILEDIFQPLCHQTLEEEAEAGIDWSILDPVPCVKTQAEYDPVCKDDIWCTSGNKICEYLEKGHHCIHSKLSRYHLNV